MATDSEEASPFARRFVTAFVVVALGSFLVFGMIVPAVQNAIMSGGCHNPLMNNGRNIFVAIFQASLENPLDPDPKGWPRSGETAPNLGTFDNSTDYFEWMVTSKVLNVDFSFFGAPGIPRAKGTDLEIFTAENNAWCVVADVDETYPDAGPVIFTRNIAITDLGQLGSDVTRLSEEKPFGTKGAIVILKGGSTFTVKDLDGSWVDDVVELGLTNRVLRP